MNKRRRFLRVVAIGQPKRRPVLPMPFHGIGTMMYSQRDYWHDGSYVTTEWMVLAWIPIAVD